MVNEEAEKYKDKGNAAFKDKDFEEAIKQYNKAITLDPDNAVYYSNRSGAWYSKGKYDSAVADANKSINADANFVKGYSRKGAAHLCLGQKDEAEKAYKEGLVKEPGNAACVKGIEDVKAARNRKPPPQARASSSGGGGGAGGMMQTIMSKLQQGGKMQMYMLAMGGYMLFNQFTSRGKTASGGSESDAGVDTYDDVTGSSEATISRVFKNFDSQWVSYMQSDRTSDSMLLMLHRTSSSAEVEFSSAFPGLASANARVIAPDRFCHGFSPCPKAGEPQDSKWLTDLIRSGGNPEKLAVLAVGREAIAQALALAQKKKQVQLVIMMKPKVVAPKQSSMATTDEVTDWLKAHGHGSHGQAAADALRWAAGAEHPTAEVSFKKPSQSCQFTMVYEAGDEEDEDLAVTLDSQGVEVKTLKDVVLADILTDEVHRGLSDEAPDDTL